MEEIKVGEYVRTDCGTIIKVKKIEEDEETKDIWYYEGFCLGAWKSRVVNHGSNIIDLIEVGDYVNGCEVVEKRNGMIYAGKCPDCYYYEIVTNDSKAIETIVTKEQFNSIKYEVV